MVDKVGWNKRLYEVDGKCDQNANRNIPSVRFEYWIFYNAKSSLNAILQCEKQTYCCEVVGRQVVSRNTLQAAVFNEEEDFAILNDNILKS